MNINQHLLKPEVYVMKICLQINFNLENILLYYITSGFDDTYEFCGIRMKFFFYTSL